MPAASPAKKRRTRSITTEKVEAVANGIVDHKSRAEIALEAGYAGVSGVGEALNIPAVQERIKEIRSGLADEVQLKRLDVINGFLESIEMAKLAADPGSMIRGWTEIGKMLGHYAPEVKKVELTMNQRALMNKYEAMSDEELMAGLVIEGEFTDETRTVQ
jgi:hypothetical protein